MRVLNIIQLLTFSFFLLTVTSVSGAQQSTDLERTSAVHNQRLDYLEKAVEKQGDQIAVAVSQIAAMNSSINRMIGIVIGFGSAFTALQVVIVIMQARRRNSDGGKSHALTSEGA